MTPRAQRFRVRYFGSSGTLYDVEITARDTAAAIREAQWPQKAVGFRLIDTEGREVFEQLRTDLR